MAYQLYRNTTLGNSLQESLDELIQSQQITPQLALQVLLQFDKAINSALAQRVRNRVNFRLFIILLQNPIQLCTALPSNFCQISVLSETSSAPNSEMYKSH
uniref:Transcription initiation factor IIA gamma chain n=1 Tax=Callorhinchus milii TaxID=7868 RepID=A0A4W3H9I8_CALMI